MKYFLAKTDPGSYTIGQLKTDKKTTWDGVTNAQAVRAIRDMRPGDRIFVYHSGGESAIVGLAQVVSEPRADPKNPKSAVVDLQFAGLLQPPISLPEIKQSHLFDDWALVRQSRLSTMAVPESFVIWMRTKYPSAKL
ncbi:MAG: EVE domain-containing protein [Bryobacteraceae bacterium]